MTPEPRFDAPDEMEMKRRIGRVREMMSEAGLTHYVCASPDNVFYLTNFANYIHERPFILVVSLDGPLHFLVPKLEIPHVRTRSVGDLELVEYFEFPAPVGRDMGRKIPVHISIECACRCRVDLPVAGL